MKYDIRSYWRSEQKTINPWITVFTLFSHGHGDIILTPGEIHEGKFGVQISEDAHGMEGEIIFDLPLYSSR